MKYCKDCAWAKDIESTLIPPTCHRPRPPCFDYVYGELPAAPQQCRVERDSSAINFHLACGPTAIFFKPKEH